MMDDEIRKTRRKHDGWWNIDDGWWNTEDGIWNIEDKKCNWWMMKFRRQGENMMDDAEIQKVEDKWWMMSKCKTRMSD